MRYATLLLICLTAAAPALAQEQEPAPLPRDPKPPFVFDARFGWPGISRDRTVAATLDVPAEEMPGRGPAMVLGGQVYFPRKSVVSLGVGGELLFMRARNTVGSEDEATAVAGPTLTNRWSHMSPQVSINFGSGNGWSYVTGGLGWSKLTMERDDEPQEPGERVRTLNYGGGAKWFAKKHLAFTLDLRFYSISAQEAAPGRVATSAVRVVVFTGGLSLR
jgi:hypothetical protein